MSYNYGKNMVNGSRHRPGERQLSSFERNMPGVLRTSQGKEYSEYPTVAKLKLSEKLKVLLENGDSGCKEDPYAFSEIDPQFSAPLSQALNSVESYIRKHSDNGIGNALVASKAAGHLQDCNSDTRTRVGGDLPQSGPTKVPSTPPQPRSIKLIAAQVPYLNKSASKLKQKPGPVNARSSDKKAKTGRPLMNQVQKAASAMIRNVSKPRKPVPGRSMSLDSAMPKGQLNLKKVPQEESFVGMKSQGLSCSDVRTATPASAAKPAPSLPASTSLASSKQDALQRIWSVRNKIKELRRDYLQFGLTLTEGTSTGELSTSSSECMLFQNCWFSLCSDYNPVSCQGRRREVKLSQLKAELRHKLKQLQWRYKDEFRDKMVDLLVTSARQQPNLTAFLLGLETSQYLSKSRCKARGSLAPRCSYSDSCGDGCSVRALPCVRFCRDHIVYSNEQQLFTKCCALRGDNSPCASPALDKTAETPLCIRHKFLSQKPKIVVSSKVASKPPQARKRSRSTPGSTRSGRSRKRKRLSKDRSREKEDGPATKLYFGLKARDEAGLVGLAGLHGLEATTTHVISKSDVDESQEVEVGEEVLALPLDGVELTSLTSQATRLLEEHDLTNVLNHIPPDAFNDLFTEDKEEYEPTPQETEELERALEAVDNDVKSLEKLSQTQGILEGLLDEQTIVQTLAQLPGAVHQVHQVHEATPVLYHNGFTALNHLTHLEETLHEVTKALPQTVLLHTDHALPSPYHHTVTLTGRQS